MTSGNVLFAFLSFYCSTYYPTEATENQIWCNDGAWVIVRNTSRGLEVQIVQISANFTSGDTEVIDYYYLPPQCAEQDSCNSVAVGGGWLALPSNNSIVFLKLASPDKQHIRHIGHDCNPTNLFFHQGTLWVTCVSTTNNSFQLTYLSYSISTADDGLDIECLLDSPVYLLSQSFSRSIFIYHPLCFAHGESNLYTVAENGYVWHFPATSGVDLVFTHSESPLENCSSIAYIDFRSETSFTVHCSGGLAATYDACLGRWQYHYLHKCGLYFSCSPLIETLFMNDSIRVIHKNGTTLWHKNHSVGNIRHGQCNGDFFNAVASNGSLYSFVFSLDMFYMIAQNVCDSAGSCFWPTFDPVASRFIGIDGGNAMLFLVSKVAECAFPVKEIHVNNIPATAMIHFISSPGTSVHSCQCKYAGHSTDGSEFSTPTTTVVITVTSRALISIMTTVIMIMIAAVIIISTYICYRYWKNRQQSQQSNMYSVMVASDDRNSIPMACHAQDSSSGVVTGMANPLDSDMIHSRDVIEVQQERRGRSEDSRNRRTQKNNNMLDLDRQNVNAI